VTLPARTLEGGSHPPLSVIWRTSPTLHQAQPNQPPWFPMAATRPQKGPAGTTLQVTASGAVGRPISLGTRVSRWRLSLCKYPAINSGGQQPSKSHESLRLDGNRPRVKTYPALLPAGATSKPPRSGRMEQPVTKAQPAVVCWCYGRLQ